MHPAQVEGQTDHIGPDEGYAESCVGGQVDHGDAREHATEAGDQPDRPHGHAEAVEASRGLVVFAHVSSPNSRASGASPPTRRSPRLRKRASLAGSSCAASRWTPTVHSPPTSTTMTCSSGTASPRTELWPMGWPRRKWRVRRPESWPERRCRVDAGAHRARWLRPSPRWERRASS